MMDDRLIEPKPCVLLLYLGTKLKRVLVFDSDLEAYDIAARYKVAGYGWGVMAYEHIASGEAVPDLPSVQLRLDI